MEGNVAKKTCENGISSHVSLPTKLQLLSQKTAGFTLKDVLLTLIHIQVVFHPARGSLAAYSKERNFL